MFGTPEERALRRLMRRYQAAVRANPRDLDARLRLADTFRRLGRDEDAREELRIVAGVCARSGDVLSALATLHGILEVDPHNKETLQLVTSLYARPQATVDPARLDSDEPPEFVILVGMGLPLVAPATAGETPAAPAPSAAPPAPAQPEPRRPARSLADDEDVDREATSPSIPSLTSRNSEPVFLLTTPARARAAVDADLGAPVRASEDAPAEDAADEGEDSAATVAPEDIVEEIASSKRPTLPLFSSLGPAAFEAVVAKLRPTRHPVGGVLFDEGEPGDSVFLLVSGRVRVEKGARAGSRFIVASLGPGSFFGEFGYLTDRRRHARVVAETTVEAFEATREVLEAAAAAHPEIMTTMLELYGRRLVETTAVFSPVLRVLGPAQRAGWLTRFVRRTYGRGDVILSEGERGEGLFVVLRGEVAVERSPRGPDAPGPIAVATLREGDFFGEASLLTGRPAMATVRGATDVDVLRLPPRDFAELIADYPELRTLLQAAAVERKLLTESLLAGRAGGHGGAGRPVLL